jgi:glycosyltransferase involved in cell wall biosynthesis
VDLTVLIPVYRNAATIGRTLASIDAVGTKVGQVIELNAIIVVDGIIDSSIDVIESWCATTRIPTVVIVQENRGVANARNVAWRAATTNWVTFLDADDELTPERVQFAERGLRSHTVYVGRQEVIADGGLRIPGAKQNQPPPFLIISMLVERSILEALGGLDESLSVSDDWNLAIRLKEYGIPINFVDQSFVKRHIHGANASYDEVTVSREYLRNIREHRKRLAARRHTPDPM